MNRLRSAALLLKPWSSLAIAYSAVAAYLGSGSYRHQEWDATSSDLINLTLGTFLLAVAGSIFNQIQETDLDAKLVRTRMRPIAAGHLSPPLAGALGLGCIFAGTVALFRTGPGSVPLLGLLGLGWYLFVYTPLKRRSSFAILPGLLVGMAPPAMGWLAGSCPSPGPLVLLCGIMGFGQLAHVAMLLLIHADDSRERVFPNLYQFMGPLRLLRFSSLMVICTMTTALVGFRISNPSSDLCFFFSLLAALGAWVLVFLRIRVQGPDDRKGIERLFLAWNLWLALALAAFAAH